MRKDSPRRRHSSATGHRIARSALRLSCLSLALTGITSCSTGSGVLPSGPNTYTLTERRAPVLGGAFEAKKVALNKASAYCLGQGNQFLPVSESEAAFPPGNPWGNTDFTVTFRCLPAGAPGLSGTTTQPDTQTAPQPAANAQTINPPEHGGDTGTGFVVSADGVVLTNRHVVPDCHSIGVRRVGGSTVPATLIASDPTNDLALLRLPSGGGSIAVFRDGPGVRQGDPVIAVGFPLMGILSSGTTLTTGTVSSLAGIKNDSRLLQISAPVQPGNSGGPLFDQSGHVVGIVEAKLNPMVTLAAVGDLPENVNFAIKSTSALAFMDANSIAFKRAASTGALSNAEIGERAQAVTVQVFCSN